ncbi:toprim domain-containing protein [Streptococcus suis]|nr:toprim domain-containing protein [Streptococcus suis]
MSYYECHKHELRDVRLIGMEGLKKSCVAYHILRLVSEERGDFQFLDNDVDYNRLPHLLDLVKDTMTFFQSHEHVITLAVDNDEAGREFVANFKEQGFPVQLDIPLFISGQDKADWNDVLVRQGKGLELEDMIAHVKAELAHGPVLIRSAMSLDL